MSFLKKMFKGTSLETEHFKYGEGEKTVDSVVAYFVTDTTINGIKHPTETLMTISWSNMGRLCFEVFGANATSYYFYAPDRKPTLNDKGASNHEVLDMDGRLAHAQLIEIVPANGEAYLVHVPQGCVMNLLAV